MSPEKASPRNLRRPRDPMGVLLCYILVFQHTISPGPAFTLASFPQTSDPSCRFTSLCEHMLMLVALSNWRVIGVTRMMGQSFQSRALSSWPAAWGLLVCLVTPWPPHGHVPSISSGTPSPLHTVLSQRDSDLIFKTPPSLNRNK